MNGCTVITSKENFKIPKIIRSARIIVHQTKLEWKFRTLQEAITASKAFADTGFSYVYRP